MLFFSTFCVGKSQNFFMADREKMEGILKFLDCLPKVKIKKLGLKLCLPFRFLGLFRPFYMTTEGFGFYKVGTFFSLSKKTDTVGLLKF